MPPAKAARLLFQLPRECRTYAKVAPASQWGWAEVLSNKTNHLLEVLIWTKTRDAQKKMPRNKPKLWLPEFMPQPPSGAVDEGAEAHTTDDIREILAKPRV